MKFRESLIVHYVCYGVCMAYIWHWPEKYLMIAGFALTTLLVFMEDLQNQIDNETK